MSQSGSLTTTGSGASPIETLTGNSGGPVSADAAFNINVIGNNTAGINIVGTPGTNTLTVSCMQATTAQRGTVFLATDAQAIAGTDTVNALTSSNLAAKLGTQTIHSLALFQGSTGAMTPLGAATNGQIPIGSTGLDPVLATITAGAGITVSNGAGTITISATGADFLAYTQVTFAMSPYLVLSTDEYLGVNTSAGGVTILLPNAPSTGRVFYIKDRNGTSSTNTIGVTTVGGAVLIDAAATYTINTDYEAIQVIFNGSAYEVF
jgi:hypothetical protein